MLPKNIFGKARYRLFNALHLCGYKVPSGFVSDGATVPRILWSVFPPAGPYFWAAVLHDYLLKTGHNRLDADKQFRLACIEEGVSTVVTNITFIGVVVYGFISTLGYTTK